MTVNAHWPVGRFAPSPSGRMHLGNISTALLSWLSVKSRGGLWILRHEDLDTQRSKTEHMLRIEEDLNWLGLDWDVGGLESRGMPDVPFLQSKRYGLYGEALRKLAKTGMVYECYCTRADLMTANAPHQSDGRVVYPGSCRPAILPHHGFDPEKYLTEKADQGNWRSLRIAVPDRDISFRDKVCGVQTYNLSRDCGDFVVYRRGCIWSYQLAVVADDAAMGVTEVARGNDLLLSTAQQIYLYESLGLKAPEFMHLPLLVNENGQRLSKRDRSLDMESLRRCHTPEALLGKLGHLLGLTPDDTPITAKNMMPFFNQDILKRQIVVKNF